MQSVYIASDISFEALSSYRGINVKRTSRRSFGCLDLSRSLSLTLRTGERLCSEPSPFQPHSTTNPREFHCQHKLPLWLSRSFSQPQPTHTHTNCNAQSSTTNIIYVPGGVPSRSNLTKCLVTHYFARWRDFAAAPYIYSCGIWARLALSLDSANYTPPCPPF